MSKVNIKRLDSVTANDATATKLINDNFEAIQTAIDNTLSRDGSAPNYMDTVLDMNSRRIINTTEPVEDRDVINLGYFKEYIGNSKEYAEAAAVSARRAESSAQSAKISETNAINSAQSASNFATEAEASANRAEVASKDPNVVIVGTDLALDNSTIKNVATNIDDVKATGMIVDEVVNVSTNMASVLTVSDNIVDVNNVANNMEDVKAAVVSAASASTSATNAAESERRANVWAEGIDTDVESLGGVHSAKGWAELAGALIDVHPASETVAGIAKIATQAEVNEGIADDNIVSPLKLNTLLNAKVGSGLQCSFDGIYENGVLTFTPAPSGIAYELKQNFDYGIDLRWAAVGELPENTPIRIMNGTDEIKIKNILNFDRASTATWKELKQCQYYNSETGYSWDFFARFSITDSSKVFTILPSVSNIETYTDRVQDCLLDSPNLIQYTSTNNSLTILAGSILVYPDGTDSFLKNTISSSIAASYLPADDQIIFADSTQLYYINADQVYAGTTAPVGYDMMLWYDTLNNLMKYTEDAGTTWKTGYSLPVGIGSTTSGIKECFCNGIFYFAGCLIVLDGVRVSIPNGKTDKGSFKNIEYCVQSPIISNRTDTYEGMWSIRNNGTIYYSTTFTINSDNFVQDVLNNKIACCPMGNFNITTGRIQKLSMRPVMKLATAEEAIVKVTYWD